MAIAFDKPMSPKDFCKIVSYLERHEDDIALGVDDFYELRAFFQYIMGVPPVASAEVGNVEAD